MKQVKVDKEKCLGCGTCVALVPELFKMDPDSKAEVIEANIVTVSDDKIMEAVNSCPTQAISAS